MTIWFSADHHFNHANIIKYCNRPFSSVKEMDSVLIDRWNSKINPNDEVYYLGDLTLGNYGTARSYLNKLNGKIKFIKGNHDEQWFYVIDSQYRLSEIHELNINKKLFVLCHYPLASWQKSHYGSIHLHGHCHGTIGVLSESSDTQLPPNEKRGKRLDVGVDTNDFYPYGLEDILERVNKNE